MNRTSANVESRAAECRRAADYMAAHPGCTLRDLAAGASLNNASKVVSGLIRDYGYFVRRERVRTPCRDGEHSRCEKRYWLEGRPLRPQLDLFHE